MWNTRKSPLLEKRERCRFCLSERLAITIADSLEEGWMNDWLIDRLSDSAVLFGSRPIRQVCIPSPLSDFIRKLQRPGNSIDSRYMKNDWCLVSALSLFELIVIVHSASDYWRFVCNICHQEKCKTSWGFVSCSVMFSCIAEIIAICYV